MPEHATGTRLLFLTKSDCVDDILHLDHGGQSIISFDDYLEAAGFVEVNYAKIATA